MRRLLSILLILLFASPLSAFHIRFEDRAIPNHDPKCGHCAWACIETVAKHNHIKGATDAVNWHRQHKTHAGTTVVEALEWLRSRDIPCWGTDEGTIETVKGFTDAGIGAIVAFQGWPDVESCHAVVVTSVTDDQVEWVDLNHSNIDYIASRRWVQEHWAGWLVVFPAKKLD